MNYPVCKFIKRLIRCNIDKIYITICNFYWLIFTWMNIFPSVCHAMAIKAKASFKLFLTDIIYLPLYLHVSWMDGWHRASLSVLGTICYFLIKKKKERLQNETIDIFISLNIYFNHKTKRFVPTTQSSIYFSVLRVFVLFLMGTSLSSRYQYEIWFWSCIFLFKPVIS